MIKIWRVAVVRVVVLCAIATVVPGINGVISNASAQSAENTAFVQQLYRARSGNLEAQLYVAKSYAEGVVVERSIQQAIGWYLRAAKKGNLEAQFQAAKIFHAGGEGVKRQPGAAAKLYKAAAQRGHPNAQNWLGYAYQHGHGVVKDYNIAADWYKNSAKQDLADAQNNLGLMYLSGKGVEQNHKKAAEWFEKAADQGHGFAMNNLAGLYEVGWGVDRDTDKALKFYRSAALTGNLSAVENLKRLGASVPAQAQEKFDQANQQVKSSAAADTDPETATTTDELQRGDVFSDLPSLDASDEEFDDWLARQTGTETASDAPSAGTQADDPFGFLKKNWNQVNRQRTRRTKRTPEGSLR